MSSDLFVFDNSFFSDPFSPSPDSAVDFPFQTTDHITSALLSSSPPSVQLQNLSLSHLAAAAETEVKTEDECQLKYTSTDSFLSPHETAFKLMQRSYSSNSFETTANLSFHPRFDSVFESNSLPPHLLEQGQIRRVCSTGDLHKLKTNMQSRTVLSSSPLSADKPSFMEEANFKVGRYSAEERKERIDRYRAKRTQRNFNKTIKYACRKTLADTRPRIRGRFARNDDAGDMPKASTFQRYEDDDDLWMSLQMEGLHEEDYDQVSQKGNFFNYNNYSY